MGVHYKHITKTQPIFRNDIVPGRVMPGINGKTGDEGINGATIHFSDYTPSNDYVKEIMLEKIKNNVTLSSQNETKIERIRYRDGDIIITSDLFAYRLIIENGVYNFVFLGKIINRNKEYEETPEETLMNNIAGVEFIIKDENLFNIPVPSNRCMDASVDLDFYGCDYTSPVDGKYEKIHYPDASTNYENSYKKTIGLNIKPIIKVSSEVLKEDWDFYLRIYLKNRKSPQSSSYVLDEQDYDTLLDPAPKSSQGAFEFYKYAEMKLNAKYNDIYQEEPADSSKCTYNITDMSCDKLHPSNNGINSNYITAEITSIVQNNKLVILGGIDYIPLVFPGSNEEKAGSYRKSMTNSEYRNGGKENFIKDQQDNFHILDYTKTRGLTQLSLYKPEIPNFRSGDSAYFSGMCSSYNKGCFSTQNDLYVKSAKYETTVDVKSPYDNFVRNTKLLNEHFKLYHDNYDDPNYCSLREESTKNYVIPELKNFIFNPQNIYELTCVNRKTGLTKILYTNVKIVYES